MEKLDKLVLFKIALDFDLADLVNFCLTFKKINEKICLNQRFWLEKIYKDYNIKTIDIPFKYKLFDGFDYKKYYQYINFMMNKYKNQYQDLLYVGSEDGGLNLVKLSVKNGANIQSDNNWPLRLASHNGHLEIVKYLVSQGANIHALDDLVLRKASGNGHLEIVKFLVKVGADIHTWDNSALRWASKYGHLEIVKFLVKEGANIHAGDDDALRRARNNGHLEVVKFLEQQG